jgi:ubiquinone/menaquinone biosynthesis C-methylase UbiE
MIVGGSSLSLHYHIVRLLVHEDYVTDLAVLDVPVGAGRSCLVLSSSTDKTIRKTWLDLRSNRFIHSQPIHV